ncbi:MAG: mqnB [Chitinophagaceae bacterium]|nr:mqnB [Chitinophagaceae bacterium]
MQNPDLPTTFGHSMRIIVTSATIDEWMPAYLQIDTLYTSESKRMKVIFHQSGVGMLATAVSLTKMIAEEKPDLVIQVGIAGCFDGSMTLGKVVCVKEESLGDLGVQEDGKWKDIFDLKLEKSSYPPYEKRRLPNPWLAEYNLLKLPEVLATTINEITTTEERKQQLTRKYEAVTESMEGAALHYVCRNFNVPFIQIRAVSNYIGERDKSKWELKAAIENCNQTLLRYLDKLYKLS